MRWDGGRKLEYLKGTHAYTGRTMQSPHRKNQLGIEPGTLLL